MARKKLPDILRECVRKEVQAYFEEPDVWMERYLRYALQRLVREGKLKLPAVGKRRRKK